MEDELPVGQPDHGHSNRYGNQAAQPGEVVLLAPEVRVVLHQ